MAFDFQGFADEQFKPQVDVAVGYPVTTVTLSVSRPSVFDVLFTLFR